MVKSKFLLFPNGCAIILAKETKYIIKCVLINTTNQEIRKISECLSRIQHSNSAYPDNGQTNKQTTIVI